MPTGKADRNGREAGFTLLGLLFLLAALGIGLAAVGTLWDSVRQREREADLLLVGDQYRRALESYYQAGTGPAQHYPKHLSDLVRDPRFPHTVRHLRQLWKDPVTGGEWGLHRDAAGGIDGLYSTSPATPRKTGGFTQAYREFEGAARYSDWLFKAKPPELKAP
jgi:type II secretory pathway pseudopilin PulG